MSSTEQEQLYRLELVAEADVETNHHGAECVAEHAGEPCPGYPHQTGVE